MSTTDEYKRDPLSGYLQLKQPSKVTLRIAQRERSRTNKKLLDRIAYLQKEMSRMQSILQKMIEQKR